MRLERIRAQLAADDPEFVAVFETELLSFADRHDASRPGDRLCTIVMWLVIVLGLLQLMDGVVGGAIFMAVIATGAYLARRHGLLPPQNI
jgi:hypothetical protein